MTRLVFWLDVDNTLLQNDDVKADLDVHLQAEVGTDLTRLFWAIYEQVRKEKDYVDIPLSLSRFREQTPLSAMDEQTYQHVHSIFDNYPFYKALYPHVLETLQHLRTLGLTVIVSDGDLSFQATKIVNSYLAEAVEGRVLIYTHKQQHLVEIMRTYPGDHYVMIDDKPQILAETKASLGDSLTTVFVQQGKYAESQLPANFTPDITVPHIGDLRNYNAEQFLHPAN
ncbi:HAD family hydrolase [Ktedonosporobacter rubrisoli]|uniref:HAD family hydrolase n=1 Tax=Ktedonosporobacter rubrisoli TaxID=2509675 RepID=A0A4P6K4D6_KTERU|nr:HAD family hydrolase [Ktedonosporobacter rubrisoli]QBD82690.1 HAD family hydrolase [Ktedonosporobacter rubrisoli]